MPEFLSDRTDRTTLLLWQVARRADELVRETRRPPGLNRLCWLIAEQEMTGRVAEAATLISREKNFRFPR